MPSGAGTYLNLLCAHPPFQIDGNMGAVSGMIEMMLQSQHGYLDILPALPSSWANGSVKGLKAQGNYQVDMIWNDGLISKLTITAAEPGECIIKYKGKELKMNFSKGETKVLTKKELMDF